MKVSVFSDIACPWCYIGVTRFERAAAAVSLASGTELETTLRAYQLAPDTESHARPLLDVETERLGTRERADALFDRVRNEAEADGLSFDFDAAIEANTYDAHRVLTWAAAHGGLGAQRDLAHELWRAYFAEGADISDHDTLAARAGLVGLDLDMVDDVLATDLAGDEVRMQLETAKDLGIDTAPTFVLDGKWMINGTQPQDAMERALADLVASSSD